MTFTVSPWLVWAGASLALFGVWFLCEKTWAWLGRVRDWWLRDRVTPLLEDDRFHGPHEEGCVCHECELPPLPPERTWEQMTAHQLPVVGMSVAERKHWHKLERARKGRARRVEMTHRAHYAAMGMDYPSGLMARVRELTP